MPLVVNVLEGLPKVIRQVKDIKASILGRKAQSYTFKILRSLLKTPIPELSMILGYKIKTQKSAASLYATRKQ